MSSVIAFSAIALLAAGATMSDIEQWRALGGLTLGAVFGGMFGALLKSMAVKESPRQIYLLRFAVNLAGGVGFGALALSVGVKYWDISLNPFNTVGIGFAAAWLSVMLAMIVEPVIKRRLEAQAQQWENDVTGLQRPNADAFPHRPTSTPTKKL